MDNDVNGGTDNGDGVDDNVEMMLMLEKWLRVPHPGLQVAGKRKTLGLE